MSIIATTQQYMNALVACDYAAVHRLRPLVVNTISIATLVELEKACDILVDIVAAFSVEDADGTPHAAFLAGILVSAGASLRRLGQTLFTKLASILQAARRHADVCITRLPHIERDPESLIIAHVDGHCITSQEHDLYYDNDEGGVTALAMLYKWTLPTLAALR